MDAQPQTQQRTAPGTAEWPTGERGVEPPKNRVEYSKLQSELLAALPEIQSSYSAVRDEWDPDLIPNYIVFEDLFVPFVEDRITDGADSTIRKAFRLIEAMTESEDTETQNLVYVAFYEGRESAFLDRWLPRSGSATRALVERYNARQPKTG